MVDRVWAGLILAGLGYNAGVGVESQEIPPLSISIYVYFFLVGVHVLDKHFDGKNVFFFK